MDTDASSSGSDMAIDAQGGLHLVHSSSLSGVRYAYRPAGGAWDHSIVIPDNAGLQASLAIDSADGVHISFASSSVLKYAHRSAGGAFSTTTASAATSNGPVENSIAVDAAGNVYISHYHSTVDDSGRDLLFTTKPSGGSFSTGAPVDSVGDVGYSSALVVAPDGTIYIAYTDSTNEKLKLATRPSDGSFTTADLDAGRWGTHVDLALDAVGGLHVTYYDNTDYLGYLRYAYRPTSDASWQYAQADSAARAGFNSSINVALDGTVHIVHYLVGNQLVVGAPSDDLRYSRKASGGAFVSTTLESAGIVGEGPCSALDPTGILHLAYGNRNESVSSANWTVDYRRICP